MIYEDLKQLEIPVAYLKFKKEIKPPYLIYIGAGQDTLCADGKVYHKSNNYRLEYYFDKKDENKENQLESFLADKGYTYTKSDDIYIRSEDVSVIYYEI